MTNHYYTSQNETISKPKEISIEFLDRTFTFQTDHGVFSKDALDFGSEILLKAVMEEVSGKVLDLGCGYGPIGILLKSFKNLDITFVDINDRAVKLTKENLKIHRMEAQVYQLETLQEFDEMFDTILLNPPIRTGKENIYRMFQESYDHLNPGGKLFIVIQKKQGASSAKKELDVIFSNVETIHRKAGYHVIEAKK